MAAGGASWGVVINGVVWCKNDRGWCRILGGGDGSACGDYGADIGGDGVRWC